MKCACGKEALRRVGNEGFCKEHIGRAVAAARVEAMQEQSWRGVREALHSPENIERRRPGGHQE